MLIDELNVSEGGVVTQSVAHIAEESAKQYGGVKRNNAAPSGAKLHIKLQTVDTKVGKPFKIWMGADQVGTLNSLLSYFLLPRTSGHRT